MRFLFCTSVLACFYGVMATDAATSSTEGTATSFEEAVIAAYNNNTGWFASQAKKRISDEQLTQSKMLFLPSVTGHIGSERSKSIAESVGNQSTEKSTKTSMDITVSQNLFSGFSTVNTIESRENSAKAADFLLKHEEQELILKVSDAYANIWSGRQKVAALKKMEENLKKIVDSFNSMLEAGVKTPSDVAEANANHQQAVYKRIEAETELFAAVSNFEALTGLKAGENIELPSIKLQLPENLDKLVTLAMTANPQIKSTKFQERATDSDLNAERGRLSPSCDLTLRAGRNLDNAHQITPPAADTYSNTAKNNYIASISVTIPIFENNPNGGGNTYSAIAIANQKALHAKFTAEDKVSEIRKECVISWNQYISANAMIKASRSAVKSAELSSENNLEENAMGTKSNTEILDAENKLMEARVNFAKSRMTKMISALKILALCGKLDLRSLLTKSV